MKIGQQAFKRYQYSDPHKRVVPLLGAGQERIIPYIPQHCSAPDLRYNLDLRALAMVHPPPLTKSRIPEPTLSNQWPCFNFPPFPSLSFLPVPLLPFHSLSLPFPSLHPPLRREATLLKPAKSGGAVSSPSGVWDAVAFCCIVCSLCNVCSGCNINVCVCTTI